MDKRTLVFALHLGLTTHVGTYKNRKEAEDAIQAHQEDNPETAFFYYAVEAFIPD